MNYAFGDIHNFQLGPGVCPAQGRGYQSDTLSGFDQRVEGLPHPE